MSRGIETLCCRVEEHVPIFESKVRFLPWTCGYSFRGATFPFVRGAFCSFVWSGCASFWETKKVINAKNAKHMQLKNGPSKIRMQTNAKTCNSIFRAKIKMRKNARKMQTNSEEEFGFRVHFPAFYTMKCRNTGFWQTVAAQ